MFVWWRTGNTEIYMAHNYGHNMVGSFINYFQLFDIKNSLKRHPPLFQHHPPKTGDLVLKSPVITVINIFKRLYVVVKFVP